MMNIEASLVSVFTAAVKLKKIFKGFANEKEASTEGLLAETIGS